MNLTDIAAKLLSLITRIRNIFGKKSSGVTVPIAQVQKAVSWTGYTNPRIQAFAEKIRPAALQIEAEFGIPWEFAMIQAGHESRYGESRLTVDANNLFGITGESWASAGKPVYWIMTKEYTKDKKPFEVKRPFRKYESWEESLRDWASLIERRYPVALKAARDKNFPAFAKALQAGGYATDPAYAKKLIDINDALA